MGRMTVTVDDALVEQARKLLGVRTKRQAITSALMQVVRQARLAQIAGHCGKVDLGFSRDELLDRRRES